LLNKGVAEALEWVADHHASRANAKSVVNMSLGGTFSATLNDAVAAVIEAGVIAVVSAGNDNKDACGSSPASEATAITVGSTANGDTRSVSAQGVLLNSRRRNPFTARATLTNSLIEFVFKKSKTLQGFSNFGNCVDIFAPGSIIKSAWRNSDTATNTISGTSMACPRKFKWDGINGNVSGLTPHHQQKAHLNLLDRLTSLDVAGAVALYLESQGAAQISMTDVVSIMRTMATPDVITNAGTDSPNLLLYVEPSYGAPGPSPGPDPVPVPVPVPDPDPVPYPKPLPFFTRVTLQLVYDDSPSETSVQLHRREIGANGASEWKQEG
jgi:serine protease